MCEIVIIAILCNYALSIASSFCSFEYSNFMLLFFWNVWNVALLIFHFEMCLNQTNGACLNWIYAAAPITESICDQGLQSHRMLNACQFFVTVYSTNERVATFANFKSIRYCYHSDNLLMYVYCIELIIWSIMKRPGALNWVSADGESVL